MKERALRSQQPAGERGLPSHPAFIAPKTHEIPTHIRVLTTTRFFPDAVSDATAHPACWQPTPHIKGAALESAFAQHGHSLHHFLPAPPLWLQQVHGSDVMTFSDVAAARKTPPTADAAITCIPDTVLAILTADCLPVLIASEDNPVLALAHAGWRGLAGGVLENTLRRMAAASPSPTTSWMAWLGPAIGSAAFEVGEEVYAAFDAMHDNQAASCFTPADVPGKWHADLYALARLRLQRCGITKISGGTWCTYSEPQRFYSHRRQRDEGRMATFAWIENPISD